MAEALHPTQISQRFRSLHLADSSGVDKKEQHNEKENQTGHAFTMAEECPSVETSTRLKLLAIVKSRKLEMAKKMMKQQRETEYVDNVEKLYTEVNVPPRRTFKEILAARRSRIAIQKSQEQLLSDVSTGEQFHLERSPEKSLALEDVSRLQHVENCNKINEKNILSNTVSGKANLESKSSRLIPTVILAKNAKPLEKKSSKKDKNKNDGKKDLTSHPSETSSIDDELSKYYFKEPEDIKPEFFEPFNLAYTSETWLYDYLRPGNNKGTELIINTKDEKHQAQFGSFTAFESSEDSDVIENIPDLKIDLDSTDDSSEIGETITNSDNYSIWDEIRASMPPRPPRKENVFVMPAGGNVKAYIDRFIETTENSDKKPKKKKKKQVF